MIKKYCRSIGRILGKINNKVKDKDFLRKLRILTLGFLAGDLILDLFITLPVVAFLVSNGMTSAALYTTLGMATASLLMAYILYLYITPSNERVVPI